MTKQIAHESQIEGSQSFVQQTVKPHSMAASYDKAESDPMKAQAGSGQRYRLSYSIRRRMSIKRWLARTARLVQRGWGGRLFSFLCVGGFAALINVLCFSIVYFRTV